MTKEFEAKFPPGTYDPLSIDMEREQLWFKLQNKYFQKDSDGKPSKVARAYTSKYNFDIEVDGGINFENSKSVIEAGANILVSGTTIFKSNNGDIKKNIDTLKSS